MTSGEYPEQPRSRPAINMWQTGRLAFARATAHPAEKRRSLGMLLAAADLPGTTWRLLGESSWRMGVGNRFGAISHRARKSGSCTAIRRYRREDPAGGLFIQRGVHRCGIRPRSRYSVGRSRPDRDGTGCQDPSSRWSGLGRTTEHGLRAQHPRPGRVKQLANTAVSARSGTPLWSPSDRSATPSRHHRVTQRS